MRCFVQKCFNTSQLFLAREIRQNLAKDVAKMKELVPGFRPGLAIVQVGGREDSNVYIRMKMRAAEEIGMRAEHIKLPKSTTQLEVSTICAFSL